MNRVRAGAGGVAAAVALAALGAAHAPAAVAAPPVGSVHGARLPVVSGVALARLRWTALRPPDRLRLGFVLAPARPAALEAYARAVATPGSSAYRHYLSPAALAVRYGPRPALEARDAADLARLGYSRVRLVGWIVYASAPLAVVERSLDVALSGAQVDGFTVLAPRRNPRLPRGLAGVTWITGLTPVLAGRGVAGARQRLAERRPARGPVAPARPGGMVTLPDGDTVTSNIVGPTSVPTGLPITVRLRVSDATGAGATGAQVNSFAVVSEPPNGDAAQQAGLLGPDDQGDIAFTVTAYTPGTYGLTVNLSPAAGAPAVNVSLPPLTFTGDPAAAGPVAPGFVNTALGASALVGAAPADPASIGLFAQTLPQGNDLATFETDAGLAPLTVRQEAVAGGPRGVTSTDETELTLDLESLAMSAPGATVTLYEVPRSLSADPFVAALNAAVTEDTVSTFSISYGVDEPDVLGGGGGDAFATEVAAANAEGITVVAASGDQGAFANPGGGSGLLSPAVSYPADVPAVTAVGGVDFRADPTGANLATAAWGGEALAALDAVGVSQILQLSGDQGNVASGGGYSTLFPAPAWQASLPSVTASGRGVPDLALPASVNYPGVSMILNGAPTQLGGTSMAAPLLAGYLADMAAQSGVRLGDINPTLYAAVAANPGLMTQAQYGYDGEWQVSPGPWNPLTGLGTPNVDALAAALTQGGVARVATLTSSLQGPQSVAPGQRLTVTFTALTTAGLPVAGESVAFGVTGTLSAADLSAPSGTTDGAGQVSVSYVDTRPGDSGTVTASAAGVTGASPQITVAVPQPASLRLSGLPTRLVAGRTVRFQAVAAAATGFAIPTSLPVTVTVTGPASQRETAEAGPGAEIPLRLTVTGAYRVTVAIAATPAIAASAAVVVEPAPPARFTILRAAPGGYTPGTVWREGVAAYDRYGNLDTLIRGTVVWQFTLGALSRRVRTHFVAGEAWASFAVPADARGRLYAHYTATWRQS